MRRRRKMPRTRTWSDASVPERLKCAKDKFKDARRAQRTNSRMPKGQKAGPKGRQLEVGAKRALDF